MWSQRAPAGRSVGARQGRPQAGRHRRQVGRDDVVLASKIVGRSTNDWFRDNRGPTRVTRAQIREAVDVPPQTTRARLRGDFVRTAREHGRDVTVDWVHLKINDEAQRTVLCKDPFRAVDERVDRLLELLASRPTPAGP